MCGIAGFLRLRPDAELDASCLARMSSAIRHRGPDDAGEYFDVRGRCGLAFRRLSIIDLATGHQPLGNEDGSLQIVFNGEIYNYRELRAQLCDRGHRFATASDTEVLVHGFEEWDVGLFERLAGMFALALWDERDGRLVLARDRFGKKPLVYGVHDGRLRFASELKSLLALPDQPRAIDPQALHEYLLFQYVPAPRTIYAGLSKLEPGTWVEFQADSEAPPRSGRYWRLPTPPMFRGRRRDAEARLEELLLSSVERRLMSDVPLGAFLSGGLDSSLVVAAMVRLGVQPVRTFTVGFADARYDESAAARHTAAVLRTAHDEQTVAPDAIASLPTLVHHFDEPMADSSAIPTLAVSAAARRQVTVALTGDGGDEAFLGYDRYRAAAWAGALERTGVARGLAGRLSAWIGPGEPRTARNRAHRFLSALSSPAELRYLEWVAVFSPSSLTGGYRGEFRERIRFDDPLARFAALFRAAGDSDALRANRVDFATYLPFDLLTKVDTASMACSLECRCPFLDHEMIEFALSLPEHWRRRKALLRSLAARWLPREVLTRPKRGFGVPVGEWFRGPLRAPLHEALLAPGSIARSIFCADWLEQRLAQHDRWGHLGHPLWSLFLLEQWRRHWGPTGPA